jgi:hypothetical protein
MLGGTKRYSLFQNHPDWLWGPPSLLLEWCRTSFLGEKWLGYEVDHSPPFNAEVKNE